MSKISSDFRSLFGVQYLHDFTLGKQIEEYQAGLAVDVSQNEIRLTGRVRDKIPEWNLSVIF